MQETPKAIQIQLGRLFGSVSTEAKKQHRTNTAWRKTLHKWLDELFRYAEENIDTDELHWLMICSCFAACSDALKEEEFWPSYTEGVMRLAFLLMGDYPDHRGRKGGKKKADHYKLDRFRSLFYIQSTNQKLHTMLGAGSAGFPKLSKHPRKALDEFRSLSSTAADYRAFIKWYKDNYSSDYATLF